MAGDWIPLRTDLHEDPAVISIAAATGLDEYAVVGRLHRLWSWANRQLTDGVTQQVTDSWVDRYLSTPGFAAAMLAAGWLSNEGSGIGFPNFDRWNSQCAKRRIEKTQQKRNERSRQKPDSVADLSPVGGDSVADPSPVRPVSKATVPRQLRDRVFARDGRACVNCNWGPADGRPPVGIPLHDVLSVDHIVPECRGGATDEANLVTLCMRCDQIKGDRTFEEAGMSPNLSHICGDKTATDRRPEKRREEERRGEDTNTPQPPAGGGVGVPLRVAPAAVEPDPEPGPGGLITPPRFEEVRSAWNALGNGLPAVEHVSPKLRTMFAARCLTPLFCQRWRDGLAAVARSPRCHGATGWTATLKWFFSDGSLEELLNGEFDPRPAAGGAAPAPDRRQAAIDAAIAEAKQRRVG